MQDPKIPASIYAIIAICAAVSVAVLSLVLVVAILGPEHATERLIKIINAITGTPAGLTET